LSHRPDFYPPAYEEILDAEKQTCPEEGEALDIPPPLYTEMALELEDETDVHPQAPPSYQESIDDLEATETSREAERPSPVLNTGDTHQHSGPTFVGISC
jgi:hypothetical protein